MMWHSAKQGGRMKNLGTFCRKHFRRRIRYIPVIVPVTVEYEINGKKIIRKDYEYQLKCPVCWEQEKNN